MLVVIGRAECHVVPSGGHHITNALGNDDGNGADAEGVFLVRLSEAVSGQVNNEAAHLIHPADDARIARRHGIMGEGKASLAARSGGELEALVLVKLVAFTGQVSDGVVPPELEPRQSTDVLAESAPVFAASAFRHGLPVQGNWATESVTELGKSARWWAATVLRRADWYWPRLPVSGKRN